MIASTKINRHSFQLLATFCVALSFGFLQTETISAQIRLGTGIYWDALTSCSDNRPNPRQSSPKQESVPPLRKADSILERKASPSVVDINQLKELSARQRAAAANRVEPYLGKPVAWQYYPAADAVPLPSKPVGSTTDRRVAPLIIRSPFADFSTRIPTIADAMPSQKVAERSFRNGEYAKAHAAVEAAIELDPNNGNLLMFAALTNLAVADYDAAGRRFATAATVLDVENWINVFAMADQFYGVDENANHLEGFFAACESSHNVNARRLRGYLAFELHKFETAQKDFEFVIISDANDPIIKKLFASCSESTDSLSASSDSATAVPHLTPVNITTQLQTD